MGFKVFFLIILFLFNLVLGICFIARNNEYVFKEKFIPRDVSEHTESYPTFYQIYSAIKNEPSIWIAALEKKRVVNNNWLSNIF